MRVKIPVSQSVEVLGGCHLDEKTGGLPTQNPNATGKIGGGKVTLMKLLCVFLLKRTCCFAGCLLGNTQQEHLFSDF